RRSTSEKARLIAFLLKGLLGNTLVTKHSGPRLGFAGTVVDPVEVLVRIAERFKYIARELQTRYGDRATLSLEDEHDAQDLFRALLKLFFEDVRKEDPAPNVGGGSSRIDFVLPDHAIAVELKQGRESLSARELGEQLMVDIERYKKHPNVRRLVCLVFDEDGHIENPRGIERDLSRVQDDIAVTVRIVDR
ncbi:MAG: hypothetical protein ACREDR_12240, partial [Blastocatellia bacterium]